MTTWFSVQFKDFKEFTFVLSKRLGKLKKQGLPDYELTAKTVLQDWNT